MEYIQNKEVKTGIIKDISGNKCMRATLAGVMFENDSEKLWMLRVRTTNKGGGHLVTFQAAVQTHVKLFYQLSVGQYAH